MISAAFVTSTASMQLCSEPTMLSNTSSQRMSRVPNLRIMYLLAGNINVPRNLRRPSGKSMYRTGFRVSSCDRAPCTHPREPVKYLADFPPQLHGARNMGRQACSCPKSPGALTWHFCYPWECKMTLDGQHKW